MGNGERLAWSGQTSRLLRDLLQSRPEYRRLWQERAQRRHAGDVSQAGVARVIALYLWGSGERSDSDTALARNLKDRVRRALAGQSVTPQTLAWFIEAFHMDPRDARALWASFAGDRDTQAGLSLAGPSPREPAAWPRVRTVALFERYSVGPDGLLAGRRTWHTIVALEDDVDACPLAPGLPGERTEVLHGGVLSRPGDAILLERKLARGQALGLEYLSGYPSGGHRAAEVRRPAPGRLENVDLAVTFPAGRRPARVYWAVWPDQRAGAPVSEEPLPLDARHRAHRFTAFIADAVVGFRWEW
jgi:hypothetical protein